MNKLELQYSLEKIYKLSEDPHSIYTPFELCENMINSIQYLNGDILVISNLEFLIILKTKGLDMNNIYYSTSCELKKRVAVNLGVSLNNILELEYNKEVNITANMKFDIIIQNPPYNPNSLWKKFVEKGIELLKDGGKMIAIHPDSWRIASSHHKFHLKLKKHLSELHMLQYFWAAEKVSVSVDWYVYNKEEQKECKVYYPNYDIENIDISKIDRIHKFSQNSIQLSILNKISTHNYNNEIIIKKGWEEMNIPQVENGRYKQCGGNKNQLGWLTDKFTLTDSKTEHQLDNKIVIAYAGKPRPRYFSGKDEIGVFTGSYWLTDKINSNPDSIVLFLEHKMIWKLIYSLIDPEPGVWKPYGTPAMIPLWYLRELKIENLYVKSEDELYKHFNLTEEEINWINN